MARGIIAIMIILVVLAGGVYALDAAANSAGEDRDISGETFTPTAGSVTTLDHSNLADAEYQDRVTVEDSNGNLVDPGADYVWFQDNGTIKTVTGGALDGESSATVDYEYQTSTEQTRAIASVTAQIPNLGWALAPLFAFALLILVLKP